MFNVNVSQLGNVVVKTSEQGGLSNEQIADLAVEKIASVSEDTPSHLKEQAKLFKEQLKGIIHHYLLLARQEERDTIMKALRTSGHNVLDE
mgnify:CR=1 FL=1